MRGRLVVVLFLVALTMTAYAVHGMKDSELRNAIMLSWGACR